MREMKHANHLKRANHLICYCFAMLFLFSTGYVSDCEAVAVKRKEPAEVRPNPLKNTGKAVIQHIKTFKRKITDRMRMSDNSKILESKNMSDLLPFVDRDTIVIFDVDYTLFHSKTCLGSPEWGLYLLQKEMKKGQKREVCFNKNYPAWLKAQQFNEIELLDKKIPHIIKALNNKSLGYIALTSRLSTALEITRWQLHKFNIEFNKSPLAAHAYASSFKHPAVFREGVLFCHDFNNKGDVFTEWFAQIEPQLKRKKGVKRIVFVDDVLENLVSVQEAAENMGLEFVGIRYSKADAVRKKHLKPLLVEQEKAILMTNCSDTETRLLLENAGSYEEEVEVEPDPHTH